MNYFELKQFFLDDLSGIYQTREAEQIFFMILEELFQFSKMDYSLDKLKTVEQDKTDQIISLLKDLKTNKPIQHILGYGYCFERKFIVSPDVLIPRQETEELIDLILKNHNKEKARVLDIGTGTACIPINLKIENTLFEVSSLDVSKDALKIAKLNAKKFSVDINFIHQDILDEKAWSIFNDEYFDIIVSNPPYIRESEKIQMHNNVLDFDPALALFVDDNNPLIFYDKIALFASRKLQIGGVLYFEINEAFGNEVVTLIKKYDFEEIELINDLQDKNRIVKAKKVPNQI